MSRIFISYARSDGAEIAQELANRLRALNHDIFLDIEGIPGGSEWEKQLIHRTKWCDVLLLLVTEGSNQSRYVYHEFREAEKHGKLIIPIQAEDAVLPPHLTHLNTLAFKDGNYDGVLLKLELSLRHPATSPRRWRVAGTVAIGALIVLSAAIAFALLNNRLPGTPLPTSPPTEAATATNQPQTVVDFQGVTFPLYDDFEGTTPGNSPDLLRWQNDYESCVATRQDGVMSLTGTCGFILGQPQPGSQVLGADVMISSEDPLAARSSYGVNLLIYRGTGVAACGLGVTAGVPTGYFGMYQTAGEDAVFEETTLLAFDTWFTLRLVFDAERGTFTCTVGDRSLGTYTPARAGAIMGQNLDSEITASIDNVLSNVMPGFGLLEAPTANQTVSGMMEIAGWVLVHPAVARIDILVDGAPVAEASYGTLREDVSHDYPIAAARQAGFIGELDTRTYANGSYTLEIRVSNGSETTYVLQPGPITIHIRN